MFDDFVLCLQVKHLFQKVSHRISFQLNISVRLTDEEVKARYISDSFLLQNKQQDKKKSYDETPRTVRSTFSCSKTNREDYVPSRLLFGFGLQETTVVLLYWSQIFFKSDGVEPVKLWKLHLDATRVISSVLLRCPIRL